MKKKEKAKRNLRIFFAAFAFIIIYFNLAKKQIFKKKEKEFGEMSDEINENYNVNNKINN